MTTPATTTPTGTVNFRNAANASLSGCGAVALTGTGATKTATCSVTETTTGAKSYTAVYSGNVNFNTLTSAAQSVTVKTVSTTALNTLTPAGAIAYATSRAYSGTVTPAAATGSVQVLAGTTLMCTATLTGTTTKTFTCSSTLIPDAGTHSITAKYLGDSATNGSTSAAQSQTISKINPTTVALASSTATPALNTSFTLTATITTPATTSATGTVNFRNAANASLTNCAAVALTGTGTTKTATCSVTETTAGTKTYNALYSGDTNFNSGANPTASVTLTAPNVSTATTVTTSATTLDFPNTPTLTATVATTVTPNTVTGGTVTFKRLNIDVPGCVNLPLTTAGTNKIATCTPASASLPVGTHTFTAHYGGVVGFAASSGSSPTITINEPPPANNNVGNNSEVNPVLVDAFYVHPDHLGTPRVVTKPLDNKRVWEWQSTPFGESAANENPQGITGAAQAANEFRYNLRFPGQFLDAETSKHYNYFRDYDSSTGRYVESDPIGLSAGINTFGYVNARPNQWSDWFGLAPGLPIKPPRPRPPPVDGGNGNTVPGFTEQDYICSVGGKAGNSNPCTLQCCIDHDNCYALYGCNSSSFFGSWQSPCQGCNATFAKCALKSQNCNRCPGPIPPSLPPGV